MQSFYLFLLLPLFLLISTENTNEVTGTYIVPAKDLYTLSADTAPEGQTCPEGQTKFGNDSTNCWEKMNASHFLSVELQDNQDLRFEVQLFFMNGHQCFVSGHAEKISKNVWSNRIGMAHSHSDPEFCTLDFIKTDEGLYLKKIEQPNLFEDAKKDGCHNYCGARGYFDENFFPFSSKKTNTFQSSKDDWPE